MTSRELEILIGLRDIAEIAGVRPSAVSNWRKRHEDFPTPRVKTAAGALFDLHEVEAWLLANEKIDRPVSPQDVVWRVLDTLRTEWRPEQVSNFVMSALVFIAATRKAPALEDGEIDPWRAREEATDEELLPALRATAARLEAHHPQLEGLILPGLEEEPAPDPRVVRATFAALEHAAVNAGEEFFRETVERVFAFDRFDAAMVTPPALAELVVQTVEPLGDTVIDLACGVGGLLLEAAFRAEYDDKYDRRLVGFDINPEVVRYARSWLTLFGESPEVHTGNSLELAAAPPGQILPPADTVLIDPPLGLKNWGNAEIYAENSWPYGAPPPGSADLAWPQAALRALKSGGRAAVVLPAGAAFRAGREAAIREQMIEAGVIEAVIQLPPRIRRDTSIPLTVWLLEKSSEPRSRVLFIDASSLGTPGRSEHDLDTASVQRILAAVTLWRSEGRVEDDIAAAIPTAEIADAVLSPAKYVAGAAELDVAALQHELSQLDDGGSTFAVSIPSNGPPVTISTARRVPLGDLVELVRGSYTSGKDDEEGDTPLVRTENVVHPRQPLETKPADQAGAKTPVCEGDLVVALQSPGAPVAQAPAHWSGAMLDRRCAIVAVVHPDLTAEWLALWARTSDYEHQVERASTGAVQSRITPGEFLKLSVPVPPRSTQDQLIARFEELDHALSQLERATTRLRRRRDIELELAMHPITDGNA